MHFSSAFIILVTAAATTMASPTQVVLRQKALVNPNAITGTTCTSQSPIALNSHDTEMAMLSICGGISGSQKCLGNPTSTVGAIGTSMFTLVPDSLGATINVSKEKWEGCVRAARAMCASTFTTTCIGGTTEGNFFFSLTANTHYNKPELR